MGIRNPVPLSPPPPSPRQRSEPRGKRSRDPNKFRPVGCWASHSMPRAQRSVRTPPPFAEPLPRGGTEPAPYRPTENTLKTAPRPTPGMVSKGRARRPFLWSFQGGSGREIEIPPRIFLGEREGVFFQFGKNTPSQAADLHRHYRPRRNGGPSRPQSGANSRRAPRHPYPAPGGDAERAAPFGAAPLYHSADGGAETGFTSFAAS